MRTHFVQELKSNLGWFQLPPSDKSRWVVIFMRALIGPLMAVVIGTFSHLFLLLDCSLQIPRISQYLAHLCIEVTVFLRLIIIKIYNY